MMKSLKNPSADPNYEIIPKWINYMYICLYSKTLCIHTYIQNHKYICIYRITTKAVALVSTYTNAELNNCYRVIIVSQDYKQNRLSLQLPWQFTRKVCFYGLTQLAKPQRNTQGTDAEEILCCKTQACTQFNQLYLGYFV